MLSALSTLISVRRRRQFLGVYLSCSLALLSAFAFCTPVCSGVLPGLSPVHNTGDVINYRTRCTGTAKARARVRSRMCVVSMCAFQSILCMHECAEHTRARSHVASSSSSSLYAIHVSMRAHKIAYLTGLLPFWASRYAPTSPCFATSLWRRRRRGQRNHCMAERRTDASVHTHQPYSGARRTKHVPYHATAAHMRCCMAVTVTCIHTQTHTHKRNNI